MTTTVDANNSSGFKVTADTSGILQLQTNGTAALTVDTSQNVGIGTSSPSTKLTVVSSTNAGIAVNDGTVNTILYNTTSTNGSLGTTTNHPMAFYTNNSEKMRIDTSGNVGIGTSSPTNKLHVSSSAFETIKLQGTSTVSGINFVNSASSNGYIYYDNGPNMLFYTSGSERMRIEATGNLCVGVAGNYGNGRKTGFHATSGFFTFRSDSSLAAATSWGHFYGTSGSNTVANISIYGNGSIQNATGSYAAYSDIKLKENIVDATPKLADLMQVRIRNYNLKGELGYDTSKQIGVIAQELEEVFPGLIEEAPDRDSEGNELGTTTKGVKYSIFIPMLIKAMQEQQALIIQLQADVAALKGASA